MSWAKAGRAPPPRAAGAGLEAGAGEAPRPLGRAPHPQPVRPGAPCRQRRVKARGRAAGAPWGRGGGWRTPLFGPEQSLANSLTSPLQGLNVEFLL